MFTVTSGVCQGYVLATTISNLFFYAVIRMAIDCHLQEGWGVWIVFLPDTRRWMTLEILVSDLEYADDMALLSTSCSDLELMIKFLYQHYTSMGLTINCRKTKTLAGLSYSYCLQLQPILLSPSADPGESVSAFQYLGSTVSQDCNNDAEVSPRLSKPHRHFAHSTKGCVCRRGSRLLQHLHMEGSQVAMSILTPIPTQTMLCRTFDTHEWPLPTNCLFVLCFLANAQSVAKSADGMTYWRTWEDCPWWWLAKQGRR